MSDLWVYGQARNLVSRDTLCILNSIEFGKALDIISALVYRVRSSLFYGGGLLRANVSASVNECSRHDRLSTNEVSTERAGYPVHLSLPEVGKRTIYRMFVVAALTMFEQIKYGEAA